MTQTPVLILQHPREPDKDLGTAKLLELALTPCALRVGLSWKSLEQAMGDSAKLLSPNGKPSAKEWGVLHVGARKSLDTESPTEGEVENEEENEEEDEDLDEDSLDEGEQEQSEGFAALQGIVVLDGTWEQAKSLWWRNPWLLKLARVELHPTAPSIYGRLRREPHRKCVSTLEAIANVLDERGEDPEIAANLRSAMRTMVQRARDASARGPKQGKRPRRRQ